MASTYFMKSIKDLTPTKEFDVYKCLEKKNVDRGTPLFSSFLQLTDYVATYEN